MEEDIWFVDSGAFVSKSLEEVKEYIVNVPEKKLDRLFCNGEDYICHMKDQEVIECIYFKVDKSGKFSFSETIKLSKINDINKKILYNITVVCLQAFNAYNIGISTDYNGRVQVQFDFSYGSQNSTVFDFDWDYFNWTYRYNELIEFRNEVYVDFKPCKTDFIKLRFRRNILSRIFKIQNDMWGYHGMDIDIHDGNIRVYISMYRDVYEEFEFLKDESIEKWEDTFNTMAEYIDKRKFDWETINYEKKYDSIRERNYIGIYGNTRRFENYKDNFRYIFNFNYLLDYD